MKEKEICIKSFYTASMVIETKNVIECEYNLNVIDLLNCPITTSGK